MSKKRCSNKKARALLEQLEQKYGSNQMAKDQQKPEQTNEPAQELSTGHQQN